MPVTRKLLVFFLCGLAGCVGAVPFETDDAYNRRSMANTAYVGVDKTHDYKLTGADGDAWEKYGVLDADKDAVVSFDEFVAGADLPYPRWDGEVQRNIVCKRVGNEAVLLDIYAPQVRKHKKSPVFYYTHGGGWSGGSKEISEEVRPLFEALSKEGFVCVGVMYRLVKMWNPQDPVLMGDCVVDCRDGLRFLKKYEAELELDMSRVVVFGSSAGGHIAQLLTFSGADDFAGDPTLASYGVDVLAGVSWFGPSDFRDTQLFVSDGLEDKFASDHWARLITKSDGAVVYKDADEKTRSMIEAVSPVCWLKKDSAPLLHVHGDQDVVISSRHAQHLEKCAKAAGAPVVVQMVKGAGHGWWNSGIQPDRKTVEQKSIDFILRKVEGQ
jgi:acetyl esterase/lipase